MNIKGFIARFESACTAMGLIKKQEKCNLFGRGKATALWINAAYHDAKEHFMFRNKGKAETNRFCHQIPKLSQEKGETDSDFAKRCITEMREFIDSIDKPADDQFPDDNIALTTTQQIQTRDTERQVIIDAIAKECFLMGVNQVI
jgi:hypothetical protein